MRVVTLLLIGILWGGLLYAQMPQGNKPPARDEVPTFTPTPTQLPLPKGWPTPYTIVPSPVATPIKKK